MVDTPPRKRVRTRSLAQAKAQGTKIVALTAYDAPTAAIFDEAGIDVLLVGDSAANVVLGQPTTLSITLDQMIMLTRAVSSTVQTALVVADLPFGSYEADNATAVASAVRLMKEGGAHAVKLEGGTRMAERIRAITDAGIPVVAHIGYTPQAEHGLGGHVVQGRRGQDAALLDDARAVEAAGAFAVVIEMVPADVASELTAALRIPTIGIGGGAGCDGQILVWQDAFGWNRGRVPSFVRQYANLGEQLLDAAAKYADDVRRGHFPSESESFSR
ncbi:3-methyl-2-oxobutanoate hydroxymethyltransferase [Gulosibacter bifidus]|uniref:3-methyl-2-oxobutanoate hydroxymethyltransferase n=1 Tax=Gulosibacter bifidus TaxID=272239 RepID=A0ABW5RGZ9_9MICO|nr:3-methyl-2-oxobutanoate hydroxymethyltransferase [Gulosibacter bifidus]